MSLKIALLHDFNPNNISGFTSSCMHRVKEGLNVLTIIKFNHGLVNIISKSFTDRGCHFQVLQKLESYEIQILSVQITEQKFLEVTRIILYGYTMLVSQVINEFGEEMLTD